MNLKQFSELTFYTPDIHDGEDGWGGPLKTATMRPSVRGVYLFAGDVKKLISKPSDLELAAPDLLDATEALANSAPSACCVDFHHQPGDYHGADESCPALDRYEAACLSARAAIAKARGQS